MNNMGLIKNNKKQILILFAILIFNTFILNYTMDFLSFIHVFSLICSTSYLIFIYIIIQKKNINPEKIFLISGIIIGLCFLILIPVGSVPDEATHFKRIYEISEGYLMSDVDGNGNGGRILPDEVDKVVAIGAGYKYSEVKKDLNVKKSGRKVFKTFPGASLYSFVCYIPQTIGVIVGKIFNLPILIQAYLGRLFNFISWLILMYFAIKLIPFYKKTLLYLSLLPITLQEVISLSPDALTIGCSFALIAFALYMKYGRKDKKEMTKKEFAIMSILAIIISMCKIVYIPVCLCLFIIPEYRFKNKKDKYIKIFLLAVFVVLINLIWLKIASRYLTEFNEGVNSFDQVKFVLSNPIRYIQIIMNTLIEKSEFYFSSGIGKSLESFNINLPFLLPCISLIAFSIGIKEQNNCSIEKNDALLMLFIFASTVLLIFTSLYVQWTPVGARIIEGVQGRYFIPILVILPVLFSLLNSKKNKDRSNIDYKIAIIIMSLYNINALAMILQSHI